MGIALAINISGAQAAGGNPAFEDLVLPTVAPALTDGAYITSTGYTASGASATNPNGGTVSVAYTWQEPDGTALSGSASWTPTQGTDNEKQAQWKVVYTVSGGSDDGQSLTRTGGTAFVTDGQAPVNTVAPTIAWIGTNAAGYLQSGQGTWTGDLNQYASIYERNGSEQASGFPIYTGPTNDGDVVNSKTTASNLHSPGVSASSPNYTFAAPSGTIAITAGAQDGATVGDLIITNTYPNSGTPSLDHGTQTVEVNGVVRGASYVLSTGESVVAKYDAADHPTGVLAAQSAPVVVTEIAVTNYIKNFTQGNATDQTYDLDAIVPTPVGSTSYAWETSAPTGVSLAGSIVTVNTNTASDAVDIRIIRTDDNGARLLIGDLQYTVFAGVWTGNAYSITYGPDDIAATQYGGTINGGIFDGETWSVTKGQMDATPDGQGVYVITVSQPTFSSGSPPLTAGDQLDPGRAAMIVYPSTQTQPTETTSLNDNSSVLVPNFTSTYTATGSEDTEVTQRQSDGTNTSTSTAIPVGGGALVLSTEVPLTAVTDDGSTPYTQFTFSGINLTPGDKIIKLGCWLDRFVGFNMTCTVDGVSAGSPEVEHHIFNNVFSGIFHFSVASALTNVDITLGGFTSADVAGKADLVVENAENFNAIGAVDSDSQSGTVRSLSLPVVPDNAVTAMCMSGAPERPVADWVGVNETAQNNTSFRACYEGKQTGLTTTETRTVSITFNTTTTASMCGLTVT